MSYYDIKEETLILKVKVQVKHARNNALCLKDAEALANKLLTDLKDRGTSGVSCNGVFEACILSVEQPEVKDLLEALEKKA